MFGKSIVLVMFAIGSEVPFADTSVGQGARPAIIPRPAEMEALPDVFRIPRSTAILAEPDNADVLAVAKYLAGALCVHSGVQAEAIQLPTEVTTLPPNCFFVSTGNADPSLGPEGYTLTVTNWSVDLRAPTPEGLSRGVQTIRQLVQPGKHGETHGWSNPEAEWSIPCVRTKDKPRYRWRGMLLDCGRHFMTKEFVKRYIDLLAYHKMNVLHWHLTEDQGWRIEIKKHPKLTEIGAWRGEGDERYGGFYTQEDIKEIVSYARSRYVTVVPEIEMPGHCVAALAAYPELSCTGGPFEVSTRWGVHSDVYCAGNDQVFKFLEDVLTEIVQLFPSEFIHIGGDECPKERWKNCAKCQQRIKTEGLKDEHELQSYFIRRIEKFLSSKGRRLVGWDEILEGGLAPNATVQSWRGMRGAIAAATTGHDVVSSPTSHCYLDYAQWRAPSEPTQMGFIDLETCYSFEPTPAGLTPPQACHVLGLEGNLWTEHAPQQRVDWQVFPRLCALAEVGWSPKELRDSGDFSRRMRTHYQRLDALGVTYFIPPPNCVSRETVFTDALEVVLESPLGRGVIHYTLDGSDPTQSSPEYAGLVPLTDGAVVKARVFLDNGRASGVAEYRFRKLKPLEPLDIPSTAPGLTCEYYEGSWRQLPDFEQLTPAATGISDRIDLATRRREGHFALRFAGYLEVPADGTYTFYLTSDDGSRLWIGVDLVVDHDRLHGASEERGQVILKAGKHPIAVGFFQVGGARHLEVSYEGPGIAKQPIPRSVLWRTSE